jgi:transcription elongation factor GreA-like protein
MHFTTRFVSIIYINVREIRREDQELIIQRQWQHWAQDTKRIKKKTSKTREMSNTDSITIIRMKTSLF